MHRQFGWFSVWTITLLAMLISLFAAITDVHAAELVMILIGLTALQLTFYQITTIVNEQALIVRFGIGLLSFTFPLHEFVTADAKQIPMFSGYGIRWLGHAWLFNVHGKEAVATTFQSGRQLWIGTDDVPGLLSALNLPSTATERDTTTTLDSTINKSDTETVPDSTSDIPQLDVPEAESKDTDLPS